MRRRRVLRAGVAALVVLAGGFGAAAPAAARTELAIAAGRPGTPWHAFAAALAGQVEALLPAARVKVVARGNGYWNPIVVNSRRADLGIANAASARWAWRGDAVAYGGRRYRALRAVLGGIRPVWLTAVLHEDYVQRTGFSSLGQALTALRDNPRIVMGPAGGVVPAAVDMVLAALGSSREILRARGGAVLQVGSRQIPAMMRRGRADVYFEAADAGHPAMRETVLTGRVRFADLPAPALAALEESGLEAGPLPVWFEGRSEPVDAADFGTMVIAHRAVPAWLVHTVARALVDGRDALAASHDAFRGYDPGAARSVGNRGVPLHRGAARFFRERGWTTRRRGGAR